MPAATEIKVVVTGASGLLGRAVLDKCKKESYDVTGLAFSRAHSGSGLVKLDLTSESDVEAFLSEKGPDVIIHCAAERRPDVVEKDPEASEAINVAVPTHLAKWCTGREEGKQPLLINISTDYVFDGSRPPYKVEDEPNPLNAYGVSKLRGERAVAEHGPKGKTVNLRVPVLYGRAETTSESAVNVLLDAIRRPDAPPAQLKKMDAYAVRYPTNVTDVARALCDLIAIHSKENTESSRVDLPPTLHFSAMEAMSKYDMSMVLARVWNGVYSELAPDAEQIATTEFLDPEYEVDISAATSRPRHCKLDLSVIKDLGISTECVGFETWWKDYLAETEKIRLEAEAKAAAQAEERRKREQAELEARRKQEEEERMKREEAEAEERRKREEAEAEERQKREEAEAEERRKREEAEAAENRKEEKAEADERRKEEEAEEARLREQPVGQEDARETGQEPGNETSKEVSSASDELVRSSEAEGDKTEGTAADGDEKTDPDQPTPSSPNPSFSSLRARPTPPARSPSPDGTMAPPVLPSGETMMRRGSSTIEAVAAPLAETAPKAGVSSQKTEGQHKEDARSLPPALLKGDDSLVSNEGANAGDADSDGYGEPSPRLAAVLPEPSSQQDQAYSSATGANAGSYAGVQSHSQKSAVQSTVNAVDRHLADQSMRDDMLPGPAAPRRYTFEVKVGDPQKVGDPVTAHTVYTVRTKTDSPQFRALQFSVLRRYSDFRWLHAALVHNNPGVIVPPVPEKVKLGRFAPELVEARRHGLETCINKILTHPILQDDDDLKLFLESDNFAHDVKMRDVRKGPVPTPEQKTYFGWSSNLGGPKFVEMDEWFERQRGFLDSLESQLKLTVKAINALAQQRKDFAQQTAEFSSAMMVLSTSSLSRAISTCFAGLGEVQRRAHEIAEVQSDADVREIGTVIYEHERVVGSVRKAFATRTDAWLAWQRADEELHKLRGKHEKAKAEGGRLHPDRVHSMLQDIADKESQSLHLKNLFDDISRRCKTEMAHFDVERVEDFRVALDKWLDGLIDRQEDMVREWEHYVALLERQTGRTIEVQAPRPNVG